MSTALKVLLTFDAEDQAWVRRESISLPSFGNGQAATPLVGDALRIAGRQFMVQGRVWEHDGTTPVLRLILGSGGAQSDTVFSGL